jgi:hypothetical protein
MELFASSFDAVIKMLFTPAPQSDTTCGRELQM